MGGQAVVISEQPALVETIIPGKAPTYDQNIHTFRILRKNARGSAVSKAPSMPMYWDAYLADTTHLTTEEHGAYMLLLAAMWRRNGSVPDDDKDNARILGLTPAKWRKIKARFAETISGFNMEAGTITQEKLQKTWEITQEKIDKNRVNGAKGGHAKSKGNNDLDQANAKVSQSPKATIPEPEPEPYIRKKEDTNVSCAITPPAIDEIAKAVTAYNNAADRAGWPKVQKLSPARRQALRGRLKDAGGIEGWEHALTKAEGSNFLTGQTSKPFLASFDFITKSGNFIKIMEGNYDDKPNSQTGRPEATQRIDPALANIARLAGLK